MVGSGDHDGVGGMEVASLLALGEPAGGSCDPDALLARAVGTLEATFPGVRFLFLGAKGPESPFTTIPAWPDPFSRPRATLSAATFERVERASHPEPLDPAEIAEPSGLDAPCLRFGSVIALPPDGGPPIALLALAADRKPLDRMPGAFLVLAAKLVGGALARADRAATGARGRTDLRALLSNLSTGVYRTTPDGRVLYANEAAARIAGYGSPEAFGAEKLDAGRPGPNDSRAAFRARLEEAGEVHGLESVWARPDGTRIWVRESARAVRDTCGRILYHDGAFEDVTAGKEIERRLRESERRLAEAQQIAKVGSWEWDVAKDLVVWSDELHRIFGIAPGEITPTYEGFLERVHPEDRARIREAVERAYVSGTPYALLLRILRPGGTVRTIEARGETVEEGGRVVKLAGTAQDVTDRLRMEAQLRESEERFRTLVESMGDFVFTLDRDLRLTGFHGRPLDLPGRDPARDVGKTLREMMASEDAETHERTARRALHGETLVYDWSVELAGAPRCFQTSISPIRSRGGDVTGLVGVTRDVTSKRRDEEALAYFAALVESSEEAIFSMALDGTIRTWNRGAERIFGYGAAEVAGRPASMLCPPNRVGEIGEEIARVVAQERHFYETLRVRADGRRIDVSIAVSPVRNAAGTVIGVSVLGRDVTQERRSAREAAAQREALARNERLSALGTLVAGVAHEVNNPLMYLSGNIELALLDLAEIAPLVEGAGVADAPDLAQTRKCLENALQGSQRIVRITQALKAAARPGDGVRRQMDVREVVAGVGDLMRVGLGTNATLKVETGPDPLHVLADGSALHQVLLNLVKNALEAIGPREGTVVLSCARDGERARIVVEDDGPGVPADVRARLFNPFFTTKATGTGLGLSIAHRIVQDHGGEITVESDPGQGASFRVRLPLLGNPEGGESRPREA